MSDSGTHTERFGSNRPAERGHPESPRPPEAGSARPSPAFYRRSGRTDTALPSGPAAVAGHRGRWALVLSALGMLIGILTVPGIALAEPGLDGGCPGADPRGPAADCRKAGEYSFVPEPGVPVRGPVVRPAAVPTPRAAAVPREPVARPPVRQQGQVTAPDPEPPAPPARRKSSAPVPRDRDPQPGAGGGSGSRERDVASGRSPREGAVDSGWEARYYRSLIYSGTFGLALALVGMAMVSRRRQLW